MEEDIKVLEGGKIKMNNKFLSIITILLAIALLGLAITNYINTKRIINLSKVVNEIIFEKEYNKYVIEDYMNQY